MQNRRVEVIFPNETKDDLGADLIAVIPPQEHQSVRAAQQHASVSVSSMQRMMKKAYKSELAPNNKQVTSMRRHVGSAVWHSDR